MARAGLNWSQQDLAEKAGMSLETVKRIEADKNVTVRTLVVMVKAFTNAGVSFAPTSNPKSFDDTGWTVSIKK